ncbi:serine hydrolase [uncultured Draconibacterium sp.]|uniref:serine hydrolase domain-containing protein n=1 Tax=uncultured Draconibacterium sp. TaxID=1573823 RepID=UPI002AA935FA|nr:serine hydrolase [uncultured Draconibacterium sp.]
MKKNVFFKGGIIVLALIAGVLLIAYSKSGNDKKTEKLKQQQSAQIKPMDGFPASTESQVTFMNASKHPYNKWAFRNMGIFPSLMVPRGGAVVNFPRNITTEFENNEFPGGNGQTVLEALIADDTDGIIVIKDGIVRYERYFGDFKENNLHFWASSTKSLTGMLTGILADKGILDLTKNVEDYLPEMKGSGFEGLTLQRVLNMTSALDFSEEYEDLQPGNVNYEYFRRVGMIPAFDLMALDPTTDETPRGNLGYIPNIKRDANKTPGEVYEYHSPNVDVIGLIIIRVMNQPLEELVSEHIWQKLGVEHDAQFMADVTFHAIATGGFSTTLRDFARFGYTVLNDGVFNGQQIIPKAFIEDTYALTPGEFMAGQRSVYRADAQASSYDRNLAGYKNFWWIHDSDKKIMTARGVYGQGIYIDKSNNMVIAHFGSAETASNATRESSKIKMEAFKYIAGNLK